MTASSFLVLDCAGGSAREVACELVPFPLVMPISAFDLPLHAASLSRETS